MLADGSYVVSWLRYDNGDGDYDVLTQAFGADGAALTGAVNVSDVAGDNDAYDYSLTVTALLDGGYAVTWYRYDDADSEYDVFTRVFRADGTAVTGAVNVSDGTGDNDAFDYEPSATALADGGYAVAWRREGGADGEYGVLTQAFRADGTAMTGAVNVSDGTGDNDAYDYQPSVTALAGGYAVTWRREGGADGDGDVLTQVFRADGTALTGAMNVSDGAGDNNAHDHSPVVTALAHGGYDVTWSRFGATDRDYDVLTQAFSPSSDHILDAPGRRGAGWPSAFAPDPAAPSGGIAAPSCPGTPDAGERLG